VEDLKGRAVAAAGDASVWFLLCQVFALFFSTFRLILQGILHPPALVSRPAPRMPFVSRAALFLAALTAAAAAPAPAPCACEPLEARVAALEHTIGALRAALALGASAPAFDEALVPAQPLAGAARAELPGPERGGLPAPRK